MVEAEFNEVKAKEPRVRKGGSDIDDEDQKREERGSAKATGIANSIDESDDIGLTPVPVVVSIDFGDYSHQACTYGGNEVVVFDKVDVKVGTNVWDVMLALSERNNFEIIAQWSKWGPYIQGLDSVTSAGGSDDWYWEMLLNGKPTMSGVRDLQVSEQSRISWRVKLMSSCHMPSPIATTAAEPVLQNSPPPINSDRISVTMSIDYGQFADKNCALHLGTARVEPGANAWDVMKKLSESNKLRIGFSWSRWGPSIQGLDCVDWTGSTEWCWELLQNGEPTAVGARDLRFEEDSSFSWAVKSVADAQSGHTLKGRESCYEAAASCMD